MKSWRWILLGVFPGLWLAGGLQAQSQTVPTVHATISATLPANPWVVKGVNVVLSGTTGFARDVALEQAARQALPTVLTGPLGLPAAVAARYAKTIGSAMPLVSRYQIVRESVLPTYALTVDLTFQEALLRKNFGGVVGSVVSSTLPVSPTGSVVSSSMRDTPAPESTPPTAARWLVRLPDPTAAGQDRARRALLALPASQVIIQRIGPMGVEFLVVGPASEAAMQNALPGTAAEIQPATPMPPANISASTSAVSSSAPRAPAAISSTMAPNRPAWLPDLW